MRFFVLTAIFMALAGCETTTAVGDIAHDKVRIMATGDDVGPVNQRAIEACHLYKRRPIAQSWRCLDAYCINKEYLFACIE